MSTHSPRMISRRSWNRVCLCTLFCYLCLMPGFALAQTGDALILELSRAQYADRLRAMWLGESIANWTGLNTEGERQRPPFFNDDDWLSDQGKWGRIDFALLSPWGADDDTDIEYVYLHLMAQHATTLLTPQQIADGWREHINDYIWVSNRQARDLMDNGVLPPATGLGVANSDYLMIDAQLTTELFGALAPGMPAEALRLANLPIRTTSAGYASHAAQFYIVLYALASRVDPALSHRDQVLWMVREARRYIPDSSKTADIADFVLDRYLTTPDDWVSTRDAVYQRYHRHAGRSGFVYRTWWESSVNFATGLMALLYGEGDYRRTVQIGTLSGWDSDNGTATMGGLLGLMLGYDELAAQFPDAQLSDEYNSYRTRDNLPDYLPDVANAEDTFSLMAARMLPLVERAIVDAGGAVNGDRWTIPALPVNPLAANPLQTLYQSSANNRVRVEGGSVEAQADGEWEAGAVQYIADGAEHNFSGREGLVQPSFLSLAGRDQHISLTVTYDRPVEIAVIRLVEGADSRHGGGLSSASLEIEIGGRWQALTAYRQLQPFDPRVPFQIIDFRLAMPIQAEGIRLHGVTNAGNSVTIAELDALSTAEP